MSQKTVIITGASGNLGTSVTDLFLSKGYKVLATVHDQESMQKISEKENLHPEVVDLTDELVSAAFVERSIKLYKKIDAVLLLVGGFAMGKIHETSSQDILKQIQLNFETAYHVVRPVYNHMMEQNNGRIIFIGARPALKPSDGKNMIAYALSKSLLLKLAEFINEDSKNKNITASVVVPSTIDTVTNRKNMPDAESSKWVKPEDLASIIEFLVSDVSSSLRETVIKVYNKA